LVITGEGAIDRSTLMGKGVGEIARRCRALQIPCIGLAGSIKLDTKAAQSFTRLGALLDLTSEAQAKAKAAYWLEQLARQIAKHMCG
jgi:glycerate kinase